MGSYAHPSELGKPIRRRVVLVVEDEVLVRVMIADYLRDVDFAVIEAANAADALGVLASGEPVDIVFSDMAMPGPIDGATLARWIHEHHPGIPVLLTSGNDDLVQSTGFISKDAFFPKPYALEDVASSVRRILEQDGLNNV
jgi:DNA-binding NtrC family response regulator